MAYFTKVRIKGNTELYFDEYDKLHTFIDLFFHANKNIEYIEVAQSDVTEFVENVGE